MGKNTKLFFMAPAHSSEKSTLLTNASAPVRSWGKTKKWFEFFTRVRARQSHTAAVHSEVRGKEAECRAQALCSISSCLQSRKTSIIQLIGRWANWGLEIWSNVSKVVPLRHGSRRIPTQLSLIPLLGFIPPHLPICAFSHFLLFR